MTGLFSASLIQLNSGPEIEDNLRQAGEFIRKAAADGAAFISTPENTCHIRVPFSDKLKSSPEESDHPALPFFSDLAQSLSVWLSIGSLSVKVEDTLIANRSYLFDPNGDIVAKYDKMHLFDVDLPTGESHRESDIVRPGGQQILATLPWGKLGMTICYDLRFPRLYRSLALEGADILTVPSAFTVPTGQAHWEVLLRARAIENGCFVLAAAQCGEHHGGRQTHGHSMIIDPWGKILAEADEDPGIITAEIDLSKVSLARKAIPSLQHEPDTD